MAIWRWLNKLPWFERWPLKLALFLLGTALVLYPKVWLLPTWLGRIGDMNGVLDPGHPELALLEQRVRAELPAEPTAGATLRAVQQVVYERIPYGWDWEVWGVVEYLPTVAEVFEQGREDCDGRAVVAASLLRRMGHDAWLVSDLLHVWVQTPEGETMSPTGAEKTLVATETGTQATISAKLIRNAGRGLSYGVAVFPLSRELCILALVCVLTMQPHSSIGRRVAGCLLLWVALDVLRESGRQAALAGAADVGVGTWLGLALAIAGWVLLAVRAAGRRHDSVAAPAE